MKFLASWGKGEAKRFSFFFFRKRAIGGRKTINRKLWRPARSTFLVKGYERSAVVAQPWPFGAISPWNNCRFVTYRRSRGTNGSVEPASRRFPLIFRRGDGQTLPTFLLLLLLLQCKTCASVEHLLWFEAGGRKKEEGFKGE